MSQGEQSQLEPAGAVRWDKLEDGQLWHLQLATPKANILDSEKIGILTRLFEQAAADPALKGIVLDGEGGSFSYGASVEEHLPERCEEMIRDFHLLFLKILESDVPVLAAVRGQCLGGGLELASFSTRVVASEDAKLGQPEIVLGVIAPVASVALPGRIGRARTEDLCISGRIVDAAEALRIGLVDEIAEDPFKACVAYASDHLLPRSASSLRLAMRAARQSTRQRFIENLRQVERLYLSELMATTDAVEGLRAFLDKRKPAWRNM